MLDLWDKTIRTHQGRTKRTTAGGKQSLEYDLDCSREKVKIRLLRGRSDFDVLENRQNP